MLIEIVDFIGPGGILALLVLGGWVALDSAAFGQFMLSRPLVAATLAGWIAGDAAMGALAGVLLEVLHLAHLPAGGVRLPEPGPGSVVAGALAALPIARPADGVSAGGTLALALSLGVVLSFLAGSWVTMHRDRTARRLAELVPKGVPLGSILARTLALDAARGVILVGVGLCVAALVPAAVVARWPFSMSWTAALIAAAGLLSLGALGRTPVPGRRPGPLLLLGGAAVGIAVGVLSGGLVTGGIR